MTSDCVICKLPESHFFLESTKEDWGLTQSGQSIKRYRVNHEVTTVFRETKTNTRKPGTCFSRPHIYHCHSERLPLPHIHRNATYWSTDEVRAGSSYPTTSSLLDASCSEAEHHISPEGANGLTLLCCGQDPIQGCDTIERAVQQLATVKRLEGHKMDLLMSSRLNPEGARTLSFC